MGEKEEERETRYINPSLLPTPRVP